MAMKPKVRSEAAADSRGGLRTHLQSSNCRDIEELEVRVQILIDAYTIPIVLVLNDFLGDFETLSLIICGYVFSRNPISFPKTVWMKANWKAKTDFGNERQEKRAKRSVLVVNPHNFSKVVKEQWPISLVYDRRNTGIVHYGACLFDNDVTPVYRRFTSPSLIHFAGWRKMRQVPATRRQLNELIGLRADSEALGSIDSVAYILKKANDSLSEGWCKRNHWQVGGYYSSSKLHGLIDCPQCKEDKGFSILCTLQIGHVVYASVCCTRHPLCFVRMVRLGFNS